MRDQSGQASGEWVAVLLVVVIALGAGAAFAAPLGVSSLARTVRCALLAGCRGEDSELARAYSPEVAAALRAYAPNLAYGKETLSLPVDFRRCRSHRCSDAPGTGGTDVWQSDRGQKATVFSHAVDHRAQGGSLWLQYWLYYPDSTWNGTAYAYSRKFKRTPIGWLAGKLAGHHEDDWESVQLRIDADGSAWSRASAHHGYAGKRNALPNLNEAPDWIDRRLNWQRTHAWTPLTGWARVARGSHAGQILDGPGGARTTTADGLQIVPIETLGQDARATRFPMTPPWRKPVYADPENTGT